MPNENCVEPMERLPELSARLSPTFLQNVIDAFPDALMVIDRDYRIVLANRAAENVFGLADPASRCVKCFQYSHRQDHPCGGEDHVCPLQAVVANKAPVRVYHTHYDADGKEISVAVDAAPVIDERGEVVQVVEVCRDVTEWTLSRHILRIGHRHMAVRPLLAEAAGALRGFTNGLAVGIRLLDRSGDESVCSGRAGSESQGPRGAAGTAPSCIELLGDETLASLPPIATGESLYADCRTQFLAAMGDEERSRLRAACEKCGCESLALVPISLNGHALGVLHVAYPRRRAITANGIESLERLATELGTAIERVRAEEELRAARDELEDRVQRRTAQLNEANQVLHEQIASRARLEREILHCSTNEQQRIGRELHDGVGQELTGLSYLAQSLYQKLRAGGSEDATDTAAELARGIPLVLGQIRKVVKGLMPLELGAGDLEAALGLLAENITGQTGIACRFESRGPVRACDDDVAIQIYRIAQEAVANAVKHAGAGRIDVLLKAEPGRMVLEVRDDGRGVGCGAVEAAGHGLRTMHYRAGAIGGSLEVRPAAGGGTVVRCVVPQNSGCGRPTETSSS